MTPRPIPPVSVPGTDPQVLAATAIADIGRLPLGDRTDYNEFFLAVLQYVQRWYERSDRDGAAPTGVSVFLFSETPRQDARKVVRPTEHVRLFNRDFEHNLTGRAHLAGAGIENLHRWELSSPTLSAAAAEVVEAGFGATPAVLVSLERREAHLLPIGIDDETVVFTFTVAPAEEEITLGSIDDLLNRFHEIYLNPNKDQGLPVWACATHGIPIPETEVYIRKQLCLLARFRFSNFAVVSPEIPTAEGRLDIRLRRADRGGGAVLELKVLRSRGYIDPKRWKSARPYSAEENEQWMIGGIDQVEGYRKEERAEHGVLCCYDMQDTDSDELETAVRPYADDRSVHVRRYFISRSAHLLRSSRPNSAHAEWRRSRARKADQ